MHASAYKHAHIYINKVVRLDRIVSHDIIHIPVAERERDRPVREDWCNGVNGTRSDLHCVCSERLLDVWAPLHKANVFEGVATNFVTRLSPSELVITSRAAVVVSSSV